MLEKIYKYQAVEVGSSDRISRIKELGEDGFRAVMVIPSNEVKGAVILMEKVVSETMPQPE